MWHNEHIFAAENKATMKAKHLNIRNLAPSAKASMVAILLVCLALCASAQTYVGTMTTGSYTQKNVEVRLAQSPLGEVAMDIKHVKFARLMPVHVDVNIPSLKLEGKSLKGNNIVPTTKGKRQEKRRVKQLSGTADAERLAFTCTMGDKPVSFKGNRRK